MASIEGRNRPHLAPDAALEASLRSRRLFNGLLRSGLPFDTENSLFMALESGWRPLTPAEAERWTGHSCSELRNLADQTSTAGTNAKLWLAALRNTQWDNSTTGALLSWACAKIEAETLSGCGTEPRPRNCGAGHKRPAL